MRIRCTYCNYGNWGYDTHCQHCGRLLPKSSKRSTGGSVDPLAQERGDGAKVRSEECKKCPLNVAGRCAATDPLSQCRRMTPENIAHSFRRMLEERANSPEAQLLAAAIGNAVVDVATKSSTKRYARMTPAEQIAAQDFLTNGDAEEVGSLAGFDGEWLRGKIRRVLAGITQSGQQSGIGYATNSGGRSTSAALAGYLKGGNSGTDDKI